MHRLHVPMGMHVSRILLLSFVGLCLPALSSSAHADRMPAPETTICNKTKGKTYIATGQHDSYVGWVTQGWTYIKPGECTSFRADMFHVRGKHKVVGLSKRTQLGCITAQKVFRVASGEGVPASEEACTKNKGEIATFHLPKAGKATKVKIVR